MSWHVHVLLVAIAVEPMLFCAECNAQTNAALESREEEQPSSATKCVARYATDEFVAACLVRPNKLANHPYFGLLPIHSFIPDPLSLGRLEAMGVEELAVFCGAKSDRHADDSIDGAIEWAAAARMTAAVELESVLQQWRHSIVRQEETVDAQPVALRMGEHTYFRVPAGTFFPPPRKLGELRFTDRDGQSVEQGIDIGNKYRYRSYIEGATQSSAIFTFEHINDADIVAGHLPLELRPDVFLTHRLQSEYSTAQIELRNPRTGLCSEPIRFQPKSHVNHRLNVPRSLSSTDGSRIDLLNDLTSGGQLEIIIKISEPGVYLGVNQKDLNVSTSSFEYVFVSGREIAVAQSPQTLAAMLNASTNSVSMARRLSPSPDVGIVANVRTESQRVAFRQLIRSIRNTQEAGRWGDELADLTATFDLDRQPMGQVVAEFVDGASARSAMSDLNQGIHSIKDRARTGIKDALGRLDTRAMLTTLGLGGVSMQFPADQAALSFDVRASHVISLIEDVLNSVRIGQQDRVLKVEFSQPASLEQLPEPSRIALANMEEVLARDLFAQRRFDLGDEVFRNVTERFPNVSQVWFRRAHELAYNQSVEFDGYASRYAWVRRGIDVLLDGVEQNPASTDLIWMVAYFIGFKIGAADESRQFRQLFSQDEDLQRRIAQIIDLQKARSPDGTIDQWLVAKSLFEHCVERHAKLSPPSTMPPLLFFSRPAVTQAQYAQVLTESGKWNEAQQAWELAEQLHNALGATTIQVGPSSLRLDEWEVRRAEFGDEDEIVKRLQAARRFIHFDYWLARCKLERMADVELARKLAQQAAERAGQNDEQMAYELLREALQALARVHARNPEQMALIAGEFQQLAASYRSAAELVSKSDEGVEQILTVIDEDQPMTLLLHLDALQDSLIVE